MKTHQGLKPCVPWAQSEDILVCKTMRPLGLDCRGIGVTNNEKLGADMMPFLREKGYDF